MRHYPVANYYFAIIVAIIICRFSVVEVREIYWANERTAMLIEQGGTQSLFYIGDSGALKLAGELRAWNFNWLL